MEQLSVSIADALAVWWYYVREHCIAFTVLDSVVFFLVTTGVLTLSFILFFRCDYRRLRFEQQIGAENNLSSHADQGVISSW